MSNFTKETENKIKDVEKMGDALLDKISIINQSTSYTKDDLLKAFSAGVQDGADNGEDGLTSVYNDFNIWFDEKYNKRL